jgi:hypothetical protein
VCGLIENDTVLQTSTAAVLNETRRVLEESTGSHQKLYAELREMYAPDGNPPIFSRRGKWS